MLFSLSFVRRTFSPTGTGSFTPKKNTNNKRQKVRFEKSPFSTGSRGGKKKKKRRDRVCLAQTLFYYYHYHYYYYKGGKNRLRRFVTLLSCESGVVVVELFFREKRNLSLFVARLGFFSVLCVLLAVERKRRS